MHILTAILRAKPGHEDTMLAELLKVADFVEAEEPDTIAFHVARAGDDSRTFVTYERFRDEAAMTRHNEGPGAQGFFATCGDMLDGDPVVVSGPERRAVTR